MFDYFFHWYTGGVWPNLLASLIWVPLAFIGGKVVHNSLKRQADAQHYQLMQLHNRRHDELKDHITQLLRDGS